MSKSFSALALVILLGLVGCGSNKSPEEKCTDLIDTLCERGAECASELGNQPQCVQAARQGLNCSRAEGVSDTYDDCMDQLDGNSCASLFPRDGNGNLSISLPSTCVGAVQLSGGFDDERASSWVEPISRPALAQ